MPFKVVDEFQTTTSKEIVSFIGKSKFGSLTKKITISRNGKAAIYKIEYRSGKKIAGCTSITAPNPEEILETLKGLFGR